MPLKSRIEGSSEECKTLLNSGRSLLLLPKLVNQVRKLLMNYEWMR